MSLCPEFEMRQRMTDAEFWDHVFNGPAPVDNPRHDPYAYDWTDTEREQADLGRPCPECGELGACGYDTLGRPMIHTNNNINESE